MFTDAVLAIAITLLVIEIKRPEGEDLASASALWHFLTHEWESFVAFVLAFFLLWSVWRRHHFFIDRVDRLTRATAGWHAPLLLLIAFLPFPTALIGHAFDNPLAVCVFAGTEAALLACEAGLKESAIRSGSVPGDPRDVRRSASGSWAVAAFFAITGGLAWWVSHLPLVWLAAPLAAHFGGRLIERFRPR